ARGGRGPHGSPPGRRRPDAHDRDSPLIESRTKHGDDMRTRILVLGGLVLSARLLGQTSPFVDEKVERLLSNETAGDRAFETERLTTQWHKPSGSEGFYAVAHFVEERARAAGLSDVRWIDQVSQTAPWTPIRADAWLITGDGASTRET